MRPIVGILAASLLVAAANAQQPATGPQRYAPADMRAIAPGLADYTDTLLFGEVWKRPGLAPRERSLVTVAA